MRLLVQGVGARFRREFDRPWRAGEARRGRLVVIGRKGLDRAAIEAALALMHLLRTELRSLDETAPAVDLEQTRADIVVLSFTDSDLAVLAKAWERAAARRRRAAAREPCGPAPSLFRRSLCREGDRARPVRVDPPARRARLLALRRGGDRAGGAGERLPARHRPRRCARGPPPRRRLDAAGRKTCAGSGPICKTAAPTTPGRRCASCCARSATRSTSREPAPQSALGVFRASPPAQGPRALIVFYRSAWLAGDTEPYEALAEALEAQGFAVEALYVTSLKDPAVVEPLRARLKRDPPDVILNATAFSARLDDGATVFDACDAPVLQVGVSLGVRRAMGGLRARALARRSRDERRAARGGRAHLRRRDLVQGAEPRASKASNMRRSARARMARRSRMSPGSPPPGRRFGARRTPRSGSPSCCPTIPPRAAGRATPSGSTPTPPSPRSPRGLRAKAIALDAPPRRSRPAPRDAAPPALSLARLSRAAPRACPRLSSAQRASALGRSG